MSGIRKAGWARRLHASADRLDRRIRPGLGRLPRIEAAWIAILDGIVARQPDRAYFRKAILPALIRSRPDRLLFVGVRGYTRAYMKAFGRAGTEFWTCDIDPAAAQYGAPGRHRIADVREIDAVFGPDRFDAVILNGVFGWGVDSREDMEGTLAALAAVLAPGGLLLVGWNSDRSPDPETLAGIAAFEPADIVGLPQRMEFPDVTHVYAWYRRRD